ncbi:glycosyltransferase [Clostridium chromiireducens]|uniref:Glycosyltransferase n=1 Tax=Clostridium chromiireducens TaxID=225345 RepID=A0A399IT96_9CLOT|nr:glycosyltransferase [Clostridium chromiireducens]RII36190.1 glycosyltransferase [Clostridium chromiireducens]
MDITLCMIVKNEEKYIKDCLDSAFKLVNSAVIIDTGSTDKTKEIIKEFGEKVKLMEYAWNNDFAKARNESLKYADGEWILVLDADEILNIDKDNVINTINTTIAEAFNIPLTNVLSERNKQNSYVYMRLFKNKGYKYYRPVHEQINISIDKSENLNRKDIEIIHYGYMQKCIDEKNKIERNLDILFNELSKEPEDSFINYHIASTYSANMDYSKALQFYVKSYECGLKYGFGKYYYILVKKMCQCIYVLGDYNLCIQFTNNLLLDSRLKEFVDLYFLIAECYFKLKKYGKAIEYAKKCLEIGERDDYPTLNGRGSFLVEVLLSDIHKEMNK